MKGRMTSCPNYMKFRQNQQIHSRMVMPLFYLFRRARGDATSSDLKVHSCHTLSPSFSPSDSCGWLLFCWAFISNITSTISNDRSNYPIAIKNLGDSYIYMSVPRNTMIDGMPLSTIISLQLPDSKLSRHARANKQPAIFPRVTKKFKSTSALPLY